jgi:hypothetical protein
MCVCMFRHYLSVNGIVSFPSFISLCKYKEEYKHGEMWHSAQRAEISEEICSSLAVARQRVHHSSAETKNEELLQRFHFLRGRCGGYITSHS